jgi:hypothetical protein
MRPPSMCLVRWTGTTAEFGGVRTHMRSWNMNAIHPNWMCDVPWHAATLCNHTNTTKVPFPARQSSSTLRQHSESFPQSAVSRKMDWEKGSNRMASQVTRFDPFRFLSIGVHKRLGVPNKGARCGRTASPNNCSSWDTSDATKHLARGGVSSWHLSDHQGCTRGDLLRNAKS